MELGQISHVPSIPVCSTFQGPAEPSFPGRCGSRGEKARVPPQREPHGDRWSCRPASPPPCLLLLQTPHCGVLPVKCPFLCFSVTSSEALCKSSDEKLLNSSDTTACVFITLVKTRWRWWRTWGGVPACCLFSNPGCPVLLYTWSLPGCVGPAKAAHGSESAIGTDLGLLTFTF